MAAVIITPKGIDYAIQEMEAMSPEDWEMLTLLDYEEKDRFEPIDAFIAPLQIHLGAEFEEIFGHNRDFLTIGGNGYGLDETGNEKYFTFKPEGINQFRKYMLLNKDNKRLMNDSRIGPFFEEAFARNIQDGTGVELENTDCAKWVYLFVKNLIKDKFKIDFDTEHMFYK